MAAFHGVKGAYSQLSMNSKGWVLGCEPGALAFYASSVKDTQDYDSPPWPIR